MTEYKRHHYVPQMYMRLFARPDENRVGVYVIDRCKFIPEAPIRGQACRDYFYGKDPRSEQAFGSIEGRAAAIFVDAIQHQRLPVPGSEEHEWLTFYLAIQHSRTMAAAAQHNEGAEKVAKAMLGRKAELEGNTKMLEAIKSVRITRTNAVSEVVGYATIGASLLVDLAFVLIRNDSETLFVASDAPVVLHNRLYEDQPMSVTGYANVGLEMCLPLGPRLALFGYDPAAYMLMGRNGDIVSVSDPAEIRLLNDLQWESAHAVLLASPDTPSDQFRASADHWTSPRKRERTIFREEILHQSDGEVRTRHGMGEAPSAVAFNLKFVKTVLPSPPPLGLYEIPPMRDPLRVARVDRAFEAVEKWKAARPSPVNN